MARLEAVMKGLYYPTPLRVMGMIADAVNVALSGATIVLDACAGQGEAVALLAKRWGMRSYGVELHHERAAIAKTILDVALRGSYHQIHTKPESKVISVLFLNPPYDDGTDDAGASLRQEVEFVRTLTELLPHNGLLVFIPPRKILKDERFRDVIRSKYRDAQAWRFPDPEAAAFDQVVVIARRYCPEYQGGGYGYGGYGYGSVESFDGELPVLGEVRYKDGDEIKLPESTLESFKLKGRPPEEIAPSFELGAATGAYASVQWDAMTGSLRASMAPLVAPRPGHQAMLLAAGQLNGLELDGCLVKGGSAKTTSIVEDGKSEIVRERIVSHLSVLSLATGELDTWRVDENESKTAEWFQKHGDALARGILENHAPSFDGDMSRYDFSGLSAPGVLPGRTKPELLPIQRETSAAIVHRWKKHKSVILSGEMGVGKAQPKTSKVLTPSGWRLIGELVVGDSVIDPTTGKSTTVVGVFPQGRKKVYRVTLDDGAQTECCDDHLWEVNSPLRKWRGSPAKVLPLRDIRKTLTHTNGNRQHFIPITTPVKFSKKSLPVLPYLLGALLGDGSLRKDSVRFTSADSSILRLVKNELPEGVFLRRVKGTKYDYALTVGRTGRGNPLVAALRSLGLTGKLSHEKHIPRMYLEASVEQRLALLQGLLDTDGTTAGANSVSSEFCTTSPDLARDMCELVRSIGGVAIPGKLRTTSYTYKGEKKKGRVSYRVVLCLPNGTKPFRLARKLRLLSNRTKYHPTRSIQHVEASGVKDCVCIKLDSPRQLYITDNYIVTHNTTIGIAACAVAKHKRVVVICPTHLVSKWIRECEAITGQKGVAVTAKKISEVDAFFQEDAPLEDEGILSMFREEHPRARFLILSKEMAKLGSRWEPAFHTRFRIVSREITVRAATYYGSAVTEIVRNKVPSVECPACGAAQKLGSLFLGPDSFNNKLQRECSECEEPMWTSVPLNEHGTCRWPLARHINRRYARQFALVIDEAHQHAKAESDQARAVHMLSVAATKLIAMTGTLYGGRASSIFHLLYRIDAEFRRAYKHDESVKFAQHHGLFETVYDEKERTSTYGYRKGRSGGRLREIPGMSPAMIPILLPFTIFVKLRDLQLELPPYSEHVEIVDHDPAVEAEIRSLGEGVKVALKKNPQVLGQYLMACLGYPDRPDQEERIVAPETEDEPGGALLGSARAFPDQFWPKDLRVAEICKEEKAEGRKSLVFFSQTHRRDARGRVRRALEAAGLKVVVLDSNVAPEKREQWLRDAVTKGFDVMLTNGRLVETGMDLLFAHTIIQYGTEYSIATLRQSIRRSWRLGQTKPVKVIFMAYARTMQATAINLIARKMRAAEMVDGDEAGGLAQHDVGGNNFLIELAHEVLQHSAFEQSKRRATGRRARAALTM